MLGGVPGLTKRSGMISLDLPAGLIPAVPGGLNDHHVTVVYLGKDLSDGDFAAACDRAEAAATAMAGPLVGSISGRGVFPPSASSDGQIPVFAEVELPGINVLHSRTRGLVRFRARISYHPHVTRMYAEPGDKLPAPLPYTPVTYTHLTVHRGDEQMAFPFGQRGLGITKAAGGDQGPQKLTPPPCGASEADGPPGTTTSKRPPLGRRKSPTDTPLHSLRHTPSGSQLAIAAQAQPKTDGHKPTKAERGGSSHFSAAALAHLSNSKPRRHHRHGSSRVLRGIYTDAYIIGATSAQALIDDATHAAHRLAARRHRQSPSTCIEKLALRRPLRSCSKRASTVAAKMSNTRIAAMATALAAGALSGSGPAVIAGTASRRTRRRMAIPQIRITEITNASSAGASDTYRANNIEYGEWELDPQLNNCSICVVNSEAGPVPIGQPYPSGHSRPGIHVKCGCSLAPVISR
jgi:hypothetical protein